MDSGPLGNGDQWDFTGYDGAALQGSDGGGYGDDGMRGRGGRYGDSGGDYEDDFGGGDDYEIRGGGDDSGFGEYICVSDVYVDESGGYGGGGVAQEGVCTGQIWFG